MVLACLSAASDTADVCTSHAAHCYCFRVVPALLGSLHQLPSRHPSVHCASLHRSGLHLRVKLLSGSHCSAGQLVPMANVGLRFNPDSQPLTLCPEAVHFPKSHYLQLQDRNTSSSLTVVSCYDS